MQEAGFTAAVLKKVREAGAYAWKVSDRFNAGVPDCWISGPKGDLWVEVKFVKQFPKRATVRPDLSALQRKWLEDRHDEGRQVAVVVGSPEGVVIYPKLDWVSPVTREAAVSRKQLIAWILDIVA